MRDEKGNDSAKDDTGESTTQNGEKKISPVTREILIGAAEVAGGLIFAGIAFACSDAGFHFWAFLCGFLSVGCGLVILVHLIEKLGFKYVKTLLLALLLADFALFSFLSWHTFSIENSPFPPLSTAQSKSVEAAKNSATLSQTNKPEPRIAVQILASQLQLTSDQLAQEMAKEDALNNALIKARSAFLPRTISPEQREKFIKMLLGKYDISKIPIEVIVGTADRETDNFALQFREMLDQAGYGVNTSELQVIPEITTNTNAIFMRDSLPDIKVPPAQMDGISQEIARYPSFSVAPEKSEQQGEDVITVFAMTNDVSPNLASSEPPSLMVFHFPTNTAYAYHPTKNPNSILLGVAKALSEIGISVGHMAGRVPGRELVGPGGVAFLIPTKSEFINPMPTTATPSTPAVITVPQPDYIEGTQITHNQLKEIFPFGYAIIYPSENQTFKYDVFKTGLMEWKINMDAVKVTRDFNNGTFTWTLPVISAGNDVGTGLQFHGGVINLNFRMKVGEIRLAGVYNGGNPCMFVSVLSDNQRSPVYAIGFRIPQEGDR